MKQDNYLRAMKADSELAQAYFAKSINKTEQQKALESLLLDSVNTGELDFNKPYKIADLACGGGTLSYHLASIFPNAEFCLVDYNEDGLKLAQDINKPFANRIEFIRGDLRDLPFDSESFDLVFCWQSLGWIDKDDIAQVLSEILRILRPNAHFYASSLFNTEFDVDLKCDFRDLTRHSGQSNIWGRYTTFSLPTMHRLLAEYQNFIIHPFHPQIDFPRTTHRGIATYSVKVIEDSEQIKVDEHFGGAFVGQSPLNPTGVRGATWLQQGGAQGPGRVAGWSQLFSNREKLLA